MSNKFICNVLENNPILLNFYKTGPVQKASLLDFADKLLESKFKALSADLAILPCPFCGHTVDIDESDTLHPNGIGWKDNPVVLGLRGYFSYKEVPKEQWCWSMHCPTTAGGCGIELSADSKELAIAAWNRRI